MKKIITLSIFLFPSIVFAEEGIIKYIDSVSNIVNKILIPIVFSLCILYFFWGVAQYISSAARGDKSNEGKDIMWRGILALFVLTTIWGIVTFIRKELDLPDIQNVETGDVEIVTTKLVP